MKKLNWNHWKRSRQLYIYKIVRDCDEQHPPSSIHHGFVSNHVMAPSHPLTLSPFAKNRLALGARRGDLPLIGPTTWQISFCLQQYIFTLIHTHAHTHTWIRTHMTHMFSAHAHPHFQSHTQAVKMSVFRWGERREAGSSPSGWQNALSERALVVVTSIGTFAQTKAGLGVSSINRLTDDSSLFVPHSA